VRTFERTQLNVLQLTLLAMHITITLAIFGLTGLVNAVQTFDYIIVGGGTTGLVVANRLTEDYNSTLVFINPTA
jgi:ribulose 1,5-bisphosphate synthetase/thiazole synthase